MSRSEDKKYFCKGNYLMGFHEVENGFNAENFLVELEELFLKYNIKNIQIAPEEEEYALYVGFNGERFGINGSTINAKSK